jgi:hypothetical protein
MLIEIILGIIIIIMLYLIYIYYFTRATTIASSLWLNSNPLPITVINNPTSAIFSYGVWIYVNTWNPGPTNIFHCSTSNQTHLSLDFPNASPTLTCTINTGTTACNGSSPTTITITNNFGIQRWVYVLISVTGNTVDGYLDGRLVTSAQLNGIPTISCSQNNNWTIGYGSGDIYISNFQRWTTGTDPVTAMSYYKVKPAASKVFSNYSASVQLSVNGTPQQSVKLF